jgi:general secretion pathway protein H
MVLTGCRAAKVMTPISEVNPFSPKIAGKSQRGFTLLELLVVLSIILLASAIVIPNITSTDSNLLIAQVRQTANAFNYARRIAIVEGAPQVATLIQLDPLAPDYPEIRGEVVQRATIPVLEQFDAEITFQTDINEEPEVLDVIQIEFFPQGGSTGGILHFTLDDLTASIRIDPITGKITIRRPGEEFDDE